VGIVFQDYTLFPHLNVQKNVTFGMDLQKMAVEEKQKRLEDLLEMVSLSGYEGRFVDKLSGGEMQRVALARSLAVQPKILLLDEPFSALDNLLRSGLRKSLLEIQKKQGLTLIFVTHQFEEALAFADRIALMHNGRILQVDTPESIYNYPKSLFAAQFLGETNIFRKEELLQMFPKKEFDFSCAYAMLRCHQIVISNTKSEQTPYSAMRLEEEYHGFFRKVRFLFQNFEWTAYSFHTTVLDDHFYFGFLRKDIHFFNDEE